MLGIRRSCYVLNEAVYKESAITNRSYNTLPLTVAYLQSQDNVR